MLQMQFKFNCLDFNEKYILESDNESDSNNVLDESDLDEPDLDESDLDEPDLDEPELNNDLNKYESELNNVLNEPDLDEPDLDEPVLDEYDLDESDLDESDLDESELNNDLDHDEEVKLSIIQKKFTDIQIISLTYIILLIINKSQFNYYCNKEIKNDYKLIKKMECSKVLLLLNNPIQKDNKHIKKMFQFSWKYLHGHKDSFKTNYL
jgi:hypothetical protein